MPAIRPITATEFQTWLAATVPAYAAEKVATGAWPEDSALDLSAKEHGELLPQGKDTPDNHMFSIVDEAGIQVGTIWFAVKDKANAKIAYVFNVTVSSEYRRRGFARRAFEALELEVKQLKLAGIALHVFGNNHAAHALYTKLGYQPTSINMYKPIAAAGV